MNNVRCWIAFVVFLLSRVRCGIAAAEENKNEFRSLCGLINIANKIVELKPSNVKEGAQSKSQGVEEGAFDALVEKVKLLATAVDPSLQKLYENTTEGERVVANEWHSQFPRLTAKSAQGQRALRVASAKIQRLWKLLTNRDLEPTGKEPNKGSESTIAGEIKEQNEAAGKSLGAAVDEAKKALYGEKGELEGASGKTFASTWAAAAKANAGMSLVNDITALCSKTSAVGNECKNPIVIPHAGSSSADGENNLLENWRAIGEACEKPSVKLTPEAVHRAIMNFSDLLGANLNRDYTDGTAKPTGWTLGHRTNTNKDNECAHGGTGDACVDYIDVVKAGGIKWKAHLEQAAKELGEWAEKKQGLETILGRAKNFQAAAEMVYEQARVEIEAGEAGEPEKRKEATAVTNGSGTQSDTSVISSNMQGKDGELRPLIQTETVYVIQLYTFLMA